MCRSAIEPLAHPLCVCASPRGAQVNELISSLAAVEERLEAYDALNDPRERELKRKLVDAVRA